jgi:hypothetical protein
MTAQLPTTCPNCERSIPADAPHCECGVDPVRRAPLIKPSQDPKVLADRFARELGRVIGTPADVSLWATSFGMSPEGARHIIDALKITGRAVERNGLLYAR